MSTQKRFPYMGRTITLVDLDVFHWRVMVDDRHLLKQDERGESPAEFSSRREAITAGFDFVYKLSVDEGKEVCA